PRPAEARFEHREADLHAEDQERRHQRPHRVDRVDDVGGLHLGVGRQRRAPDRVRVEDDDSQQQHGHSHQLPGEEDGPVAAPLRIVQPDPEPAELVRERLRHGRSFLSWPMRPSHSACSPCSPVRIRTTSSSDEMNTLPSPNFPVLAVLRTASTAPSASSSGMATSILTFGTSSILYSLPRYVSVWPFCRPYPFTSLTVIPTTPASWRAFFTASRRWGRTIASIFFIRSSFVGPVPRAAPLPRRASAPPRAFPPRHP